MFYVLIECVCLVGHVLSLFVLFWILDDMSKWKKVDAAACGIHRSMIPLASRTVLNIMQKEGSSLE